MTAATTPESRQDQLLARLRWLAGRAANVGHAARMVQITGQILELARALEADPELSEWVADGRHTEEAWQRSQRQTAGTAGN